MTGLEFIERGGLEGLQKEILIYRIIVAGLVICLLWQWKVAAVKAKLSQCKHL